MFKTKSQQNPFVAPKQAGISQGPAKSPLAEMLNPKKAVKGPMRAKKVGSAYNELLKDLMSEKK